MYGGGGGGGSDIRLIGGSWNSTESLKSRIIVAGGGGGGYGGISCHRSGSSGGGLNGSVFTNTSINCDTIEYLCTATQYGCEGGGTDSQQNRGTFGAGTYYDSPYSPGGGGGYWGGGSSNRCSGGGSGYIGAVGAYQNDYPSTSFSSHIGNGLIIIITLRFPYHTCKNHLNNLFSFLKYSIPQFLS
ncbi:MAG: hypothetical protein LBF87_02635 [Treponema sp.]|nr:hypothetical protein [Treponema sp.]